MQIKNHDAVKVAGSRGWLSLTLLGIFVVCLGAGGGSVFRKNFQAEMAKAGQTQGSTTFSGDLTLENGEIITNATDAVVGITFDDDAAELGDLQIYSSNTAGEDNNTLRTSWWFEDDGSVKAEFAYTDISMDDETSNTTDATFEWGVVTNDTLAAELNLDGAKLYPETDAGLDLGGSSNEFQDAYIDGTAYIDTLNASGKTLVIGSAEIDSGASTDSLAVVGTDSDDQVFVTIGESGTSTLYVKSAVAGTDVIVVTVDQSPGSALTYHYQVWQD